jgi:hypothetical protein
MPDISLPEVRLKGKLPEGLRDMSLDDIQNAMPDVHLPRFDFGRESRNAGKAAGRATRAAERAAAKAAKQADRAARDVQRAAGREVAKAAKRVENVLPTRKRGPNPVPIAILFMLGGLVVGWILATNPVTGPRVTAWLDDLRSRWDAWRGRGPGELEDDDWEGTESQSFTSSTPAPLASEPYVGTVPTSATSVAVGPGELSTPVSTTDAARVGADETV